MGDGTYKMHPSGDIVNREERDRRLPRVDMNVREAGVFGLSWDEIEARQGEVLNRNV